jgi:hypothetical protein
MSSENKNDNSDNNDKATTSVVTSPHVNEQLLEDDSKQRTKLPFLPGG